MSCSKDFKVVGTPLLKLMLKLITDSIVVWTTLKNLLQQLAPVWCIIEWGWTANWVIVWCHTIVTILYEYMWPFPKWYSTAQLCFYMEWNILNVVLSTYLFSCTYLLSEKIYLSIVFNYEKFGVEGVNFLWFCVQYVNGKMNFFK